MAYLNISGILTDTQTHIIDNTPTMRAKLLNWLNDAIRGMLNESRQWWFLKTSANIAVVSGAMTLPADFGELVSVSLNGNIYESVNNLTDKNAFEEEDGYRISGSTLTFYPTPANGTAVLNYTVSVSTDFTDVATDTFLPRECGPYLKRCVLVAYYEYDSDERAMLAYQSQAAELRKLKTIDNMRKPLPNYGDFA